MWSREEFKEVLKTATEISVRVTVGGSTAFGPGTPEFLVIQAAAKVGALCGSMLVEYKLEHPKATLAEAIAHVERQMAR